MKASIILAVLCLSAFAGQVEVESVNIGTKRYLKATISKDGPLVAKIVHDAGISRVRIKDLPQDIQSRIGFDADEANAAYEKEAIRAKHAKSAADRLTAKKAMAKAGLTYIVTVEDIHKSGIVATCKMIRMGQNPPKHSIYIETKTKSLTNGKSMQMNLVSTKETYTYTTVLGGSITLQKFRDIELILDERFPDTTAP